MDIDHILPEALLDNPETLKDVLNAYGLPPAFEINSYENWSPAHPRCNRIKSGHVFRPTPIIQLQIDRAQERAPIARQKAQEARSQNAISRAIGTLSTGRTALPAGLLDAIVQHYAAANSQQDVLLNEMVDSHGRLEFMPVIRFFPRPKFVWHLTSGSNSVKSRNQLQVRILASQFLHNP